MDESGDQNTKIDGNNNIVNNIQQSGREGQIILTEEIYKEILDDKVKIRTFELNAAHGEEKARLQKEIDDLKNLLANLPQAFEDAQIQIAKLKAKLEREGNEIGAEKLAVAIIALEQADFSKADELFAEIEIREKLAVKRSARAAYARGEIAEQEVRWKDATEHYVRAAELDPCFDTLVSAQLFAIETGDYDFALLLSEKLKKAAINEYGENSEEYAVCISNIGGIYEDIGENKKAESLYEQALKIRQETLEENGISLASSLNNLAECYRNQGRYKEAEPLYLQAVDIWKKTMGKEHPRTATTISNLAFLYHQQGLHEKAKPLYLQALEIRQKFLGKNHPNIANSFNNIGGLYYEQKQYKEAEPMIRQALEIYKITLGDNHPRTKETKTNYEFVKKHLANTENTPPK